MTVTPKIDTPCLLQISLDDWWSRLADINPLLVEIAQEMARHSYALASGPGGVSFFRQVIRQL
jgi:hypothetical protein